MLTFLLFACSRAPIEDHFQTGSLTQVKDFFTSAFILEGEQEWIIIDTGFNKNAEPIANFLEEKQVALSDIKTVVVTHGHGDHIGAHINFPNATFYVHSEDSALLEAEEIEKIQTFSSNDTLVIDRFTIPTFSVPGHTNGNIALLIENALIMGDSAQSLRSGAIETPSAKFAEDPELAKASLKALAAQVAPYEAQIEWMLFSHSGPVEGITALNSYANE